MSAVQTGSRLMKVPEVAEQLGVSVGHVYRLIMRGDLKAIKLGDHRMAPVRVDPADLDEWLRRPPAPSRRSPPSSGTAAPPSPSASMRPEGGEGSS